MHRAGRVKAIFFAEAAGKETLKLMRRFQVFTKQFDAFPGKDTFRLMFPSNNRTMLM